MSGDSKPVLAYWDIRGMAAPIRLLLHYAKADFEDKYYSCGPAPDYDRSCWMDVKHKLGLPFPNLPYYVDGKIKICQSDAILRHVGRKHGLMPDCEESMIRADMVDSELTDLRNKSNTMCYVKFDTKDDYIKNTQTESIKKFSDVLGDHDWFGGKKLVFVDFLAYEVFDVQRILNKDCLKPHPNLERYMKRFEDLPQIKELFSSGKYKKLPLNNKMAQFGSTTDY